MNRGADGGAPMTDQDEMPSSRPHAAARDVHDAAIQRLFSTQLSLLSTLGRISTPDVRERIRESVALLDEIIDDLRSALHRGADRPGAPGPGRNPVGSVGPVGGGGPSPR